MNDISQDQSEAIIEAAARGQVGPEGNAVGGLLTSLHAPGEAAGAAPVVGLTNNGFAGRVARRTAVAASAAVLGLASVAAAATGAGGLLADDSAPTDVDDAIVEEADVDEVEDESTGEGTEDESSGEDAPDETEAAPGGDDADEARGGGNRPEIEGVDASDGLDETELELLCEGAENHGHYVSSVARDKSTEGEASHGERVREAAASDCGKDEAEDEDESDEDEVEVEVEVEDEDEASEDDEDDEESDDDGRPGNGNGHGKAKGQGHGEHGNGNGHGHDRD